MWESRSRGGSVGIEQVGVARRPGVGEEPPSPRQVVRRLERTRRSRLVRIVAVGVIVPTLLLLPSAVFPHLDSATLAALVLAIGGAGLAFGLNRLGLVTAASYILLGGMAAAIALAIVSKPLYQPGLDLNDLRLYELFVLPILLSGVLAGRRGPMFTVVLTLAFTVASLVLLKKTPELQAYWDARYPDAPGSFYDVLALPVAIQLLTATAAWLGADSVGKALLGASRADALAAANERITAQASEMEMHRRRLQDGIVHMQHVHAAFAGGQYDARARIIEGELLPLGMSLNHLLDRLQRFSREQDQRNRMEQGIHELAVALRSLRGGKPYVSPNYTGTVVDEVLVELATMRLNASALAPGQNAAGAPAAPSWGQGMGVVPGTQPAFDGQHGAGQGVADPREMLPDWLRSAE
jgi:hypothetical protein